MVMSLEGANLISLRDGSAGLSELMKNLEAEAITLLKREKRVIRDLAGVAIDVIDHYGMGTDDTDQELDLQGFGDSLQDWGPDDQSSTGTEDESPPSPIVRRGSSSARQSCSWGIRQGPSGPG